MAVTTGLSARLGLACPIVVAPMAGGATTVDLVAASCEAGAMGSLAGAYSTPNQIAEMARAVRAKTARPFAVNLFAPTAPPDPPADPAPAVELVAAYHAELGLAPPGPPGTSADLFEEQLEAVIESGPAVFSFTFGLIPPAAVAALKARGIILMGTATTVEEARRLEAAGVDAVIAQGSEAGGHRGTFAHEFESAMVGTMALVPQVVDAVRVPVVASGGIMDGRGVAAALALGAEAVQMGSAFLASQEAGVLEGYKRAVLGASEQQTRLTRAFSGRPARGLVNRFMTEVESAGPGAILPFPLQNALTRALRRAAAEADRAEFLSLWVGQGLRLARRGTTAEIVARIVADTDAVVRRLAENAHQERSDSAGDGDSRG